jgi:transcriptional regulator with PAS, ATPase and Fis domain
MTRALVCWLGHTDLRASRGEESAGRGPIRGALDEREFDEVLLLSNYPEAPGGAYLRWLKASASGKFSLRQVELDDPTDFAAIYKLADEALGELKQAHAKKRDPLELTLHISPGTPMMGAAWVILGKTKHPAELIQTSRERGLRTAAIPLDIAAEFVELIPDLLRRPDAALEARSAGSLPEAPQFGDILYRCRAMGDVIQRARRVAARSVSVLIEGESGTGKELLARAIHEHSPRSEKSFVAVNCGALPENLVESLLFGHTKGSFSGATKDSPGHFREADGGTVFLDEVGELPLQAQVKLLRVLQEKAVTPVGASRAQKVSVRVIAATNRNLAVECREGRFREDLFYRLAVAVLRLPALRDRKGDLAPLIQRLLDKANDVGSAEEPGYKRKTLSAGAKNVLLNHPWPGNVRELENTLMRATVWTESASVSEREMRAALMGELAPGATALCQMELGDGFELDVTLDTISRDYILRALKEARGNKSRAAELLGLKSRQTLNNRMKSLRLSS